MSIGTQATTAIRPTPTTIGAKLLNMFVSPGLVFDEVVLEPPKAANWLVPVILVILSSFLTMKASADPERIAASIAPLIQEGGLSQQQATLLSAQWQSISAIAICMGAFAGTLWSAFMIWLVGKLFLKSKFAFWKALEVAGLSAMILVLGAVVTSLLIAATGDASARPALSLLCGHLQLSNPLRTVSELLNCFHLWATMVLAVGLSKLAAVPLRESAFWVLGYWLIVRMILAFLT